MHRTLGTLAAGMVLAACAGCCCPGGMCGGGPYAGPTPGYSYSVPATQPYSTAPATATTPNEGAYTPAQPEPTVTR